MRSLFSPLYGSSPINFGGNIEVHDISKVEPTKEPEKPKNEEWIWVEGFKGMEKDMTCRDMQYEVGKTYTYDGKVERCEAGYHFSTTIEGCLRYYSLNKGNRFFRVKALVKKEEFEQVSEYVRREYHYEDKLASKVIVIGEELTTSEIFSMYEYGKKLEHEKYYELAREIGVDDAYKVYLKDKLIENNYSEPFAKMLVDTYRERVCEKAMALASLPDLSMDMKCWIILRTEVI